MADEENLDEETGPDLTGAVLDGRYRVLSALGRGGMGSVYLAEDQRFSGRKVVVKVPHPELLAIPGFRKRFARELESLIHLEHLHIVKVLDSGSLEGGSPYAVLQYLAGSSLEDRLKSSSSMMPTDEILKWLIPVAETLDFIHREGWMHRDIKPANILFDRHGHVFLADFGIAKAMEGGGQQLTQTGRIPGSPLYMAPEVLSGQPVGPAYDQYSLGVMIYYILSGEMPHLATTPFHLMSLKVTTPPTPLHPRVPRISARAAAAVMRAITMEPQERFATCLAFAQELQQGLKEASTGSEAVKSAPAEAVTGPSSKSETIRPSGAVTSAPSKAGTTDPSEGVMIQVSETDAIHASAAVTIPLPEKATPSLERRLGLVLAALLLFVAGLGAAYFAGLFPRGRSLQGSAPRSAEAPVAGTAPQPPEPPVAGTAPQPTQASIKVSDVGPLSKGCDAGDMDDCIELATLYVDGNGVTQDYGKAVEPYRKACDADHSDACYSLGFLYEQGNGVAQDYGKAQELYRKSCELEDAFGCANLGGIYQQGLGVAKDFAKAAEFYGKSCEGGWAEGCGSLGDLYEGGLGVQRDPDKAVELYRKACKDGSEWSCDQLKRLGLPR